MAIALAWLIIKLSESIDASDGNKEKDRLPRLETYKRASLEGLDDQEDDCRNHRDVGNATCGVI